MSFSGRISESPVLRRSPFRPIGRLPLGAYRKGDRRIDQVVPSERSDFASRSGRAPHPCLGREKRPLTFALRRRGERRQPRCDLERVFARTSPEEEREVPAERPAYPCGVRKNGGYLAGEDGEIEIMRYV